MSFTDFSKVETIKSLESFLAEKSYVDGANATQADVTVYKAFQKEYPQLTKYLNHIYSFAGEFEKLPAGTTPVAEAAAEEEEDDDMDFFGSDDDEVDEAAEKLKQERLAAYAAKKAAKAGDKPAAKSIVTLEIKPWDDETDLEEMLASVKSIEQDGLVWGAHQFIPVGYGIKKLQINCVVEDNKVSTTELQEQIEEFEDYVQSTDISAMQKL